MEAPAAAARTSRWSRALGVDASAAERVVGQGRSNREGRTGLTGNQQQGRCRRSGGRHGGGPVPAASPPAAGVQPTSRLRQHFYSINGQQRSGLARAGKSGMKRVKKHGEGANEGRRARGGRREGQSRRARTQMSGHRQPIGTAQAQAGGNQGPTETIRERWERFGSAVWAGMAAKNLSVAEA